MRVFCECVGFVPILSVSTITVELERRSMEKSDDERGTQRPLIRKVRTRMNGAPGAFFHLLIDAELFPNGSRRLYQGLDQVRSVAFVHVQIAGKNLLGRSPDQLVRGAQRIP